MRCEGLKALKAFKSFKTTTTKEMLLLIFLDMKKFVICFVLKPPPIPRPPSYQGVFSKSFWRNQTIKQIEIKV